MWWRERGRPAENRRAMAGNVKNGDEPGLLAYRDGRALGWISVAPRVQFGQLMRSRSYAPAEPEGGIWYITCIYVHGSERHKGLARALCEAAITYAKDGGARAIDAFPATVPERSDYMGALSLYEELGFLPVRNVSTRTLVRLVPAR
jgi:GNAT superfamily N-acetyltransferase